jgi:ABC-type hemin transport system substrate-binding protein
VRAVGALGLLLVALQAGSCQRPRQGAGAPQRIVCLTPSATELVAAVGALPWVVGVDQYSTHPPEALSLPKVGDFLSPSMEAIFALHPDIVIADEVQSSVITTLNNYGIKTIGLPMQTLEDVRSGLLRVGGALGRDEAARAALRQLDVRLATVEQTAARAQARLGRRPRVLFVVDRQVGGLGSMVAAGPHTYLDELVRRLGATNALADSPVRYAKISVEEIVVRAPEVILDAVHTTDVARARADWNILAQVPAVRDGRVHVLGDTVFVSPGPRLAEALERLAPLVWSE